MIATGGVPCVADSTGGAVSTGGGVVAVGGDSEGGGVASVGGEGVPPVGSVVGVTGTVGWAGVPVASLGSVVVSVVTSVTGPDTGFGSSGGLPTDTGTGGASVD